MSIFQRLWLSFFLSMAVVLLFLYAAIQWSFDNGLINYINQRERASHQQLAENLIGLYRFEGSFDRISLSPLLWKQLVDLSVTGNTLTPDLLEQWDALPRQARRPPPPRDRKRDNQTDGHFRPPPNKRDDDRQFRPPRRDSGEDGGRLRASLLDENYHPLFGPYQDDFNTLPLVVDRPGAETTLVGYLAWPPSKQPKSRYDLAFADSQRQSFLLIAALSLLVISITALAFSRAFSRPLRNIAKTTAALSKGDYKARAHEKKATGTKDEIALLAGNINTLAATLEQAERSRKDWLASTAHELRTPLSVIKGEFEAILDGIRPANQSTLSSIEEEIAHLQKLIEDLYQLTNAEIGALRYKMAPLDLAGLAAETCQRYQATFLEQGLELHCNLTSEDCFVKGDETRLQQLLENLLTNALKYTDAPGSAALRVSRHTGDIILVIEDSSPSVPEDSLPRLFEHLFRVESSRNRKTGGSGLGLAIARKIVDAHNGTIQASLSELGGLKITVTLAADYKLPRNVNAANIDR